MSMTQGSRFMHEYVNKLEVLQLKNRYILTSYYKDLKRWDVS